MRAHAAQRAGGFPDAAVARAPRGALHRFLRARHPAFCARLSAQMAAPGSRLGAGANPARRRWLSRWVDGAFLLRPVRVRSDAAAIVFLPEPYFLSSVSPASGAGGVVPTSYIAILRTRSFEPRL